MSMAEGQGSRSMHARKMHMARTCLCSGLVWVRYGKLRYLQCVPGSRYLLNHTYRIGSDDELALSLSGGMSVELDDVLRCNL